MKTKEEEAIIPSTSETLQVILQASDFQGSDYDNVKDCPMARAIRRTLGLGEFSVSVGIYSFDITSKKYIASGAIIGGFRPEDYMELEEFFVKSTWWNRLFRRIRRGVPNSAVKYINFNSVILYP